MDVFELLTRYALVAIPLCAAVIPATALWDLRAYRRYARKGKT